MKRIHPDFSDLEDDDDKNEGLDVIGDIPFRFTVPLSPVGPWWRQPRSAFQFVKSFDFLPACHDKGAGLQGSSLTLIRFFFDELKCDCFFEVTFTFHLNGLPCFEQAFEVGSDSLLPIRDEDLVGKVDYELDPLAISFCRPLCSENLDSASEMVLNVYPSLEYTQDLMDSMSFTCFFEVQLHSRVFSVGVTLLFTLRQLFPGHVGVEILQVVSVIFSKLAWFPPSVFGNLGYSLHFDPI